MVRREPPRNNRTMGGPIMSCLNCDCEDCKKARQKEDERVQAIIELHASPKYMGAYGKCKCIYCARSKRNDL